MESIQKEILQEQKKIKEQQANEQELSVNILALQKKIESIDHKKIESFKKQKEEIIGKQSKTEQEVPREKIREYIQKR